MQNTPEAWVWATRQEGCLGLCKMSSCLIQTSFSLLVVCVCVRVPLCVCVFEGEGRTESLEMFQEASRKGPSFALKYLAVSNAKERISNSPEGGFHPICLWVQIGKVELSWPG